jgi:hypothetical protein
VGTVLVLGGLCLIAIPMRRLTSDGAALAAIPAAAVAHSEDVGAVIRLRLLAPANHVRVVDEDGRVLLDARDLPAGESEHDAKLRLAGEETDLIMTVEMADAQIETAVFLTVMPDGREDQTRHIIGEGLMEETLHFAWPHPH